MSNAIRDNVLKQRKAKARVIQPSFLAGTDTPDVEIRVMSVGERSDLITATTNTDGDRDSAAFLARIVIETAYTPGTDDKVFGPADQDTLKALPSDVLDELAAPALEMNGLMIGAVRVAEKN